MSTGNGTSGRFSTWSSAGFGPELVRVEPGGKKPTEPGWQALEVTDEHLAAWDRRPSNVGLRARFFPALDLDTEDLEVIAAVTDLAGKHFGCTAARGRSNSNRAALLYRLEGQPFEKAKIKFTRNGQAGAVEILAAGQQLVVDGTHPTGASLEWRPGLPAVDWIAPMTRAGRDRFMAALRQRLVELGCEVVGEPKAPAPAPPRCQVAPRGDDSDRARSALDALDPDTDHDSWLRLGMALHSEWPAEGGTGFQLWDAWSARGTKYPATEELAKRWRSFKSGGGVALGTLFHEAKAAGWRSPWPAKGNPAAPVAGDLVDEAEARERQGTRTDLGAKLPEGSEGRARDKAAEVEGDDLVVEAVAPGLRPAVRLTLSDIEHPPREVFLLGRMIPRAKSSVLFGPQSVGKSALAAQLVTAIAAGERTLWGLPLLDGGGPVLVYTAEDTLDDWNRKLAAIREDGRIDVTRALERLYIIDQSEGVARLTELVTEREGSIITTTRRVARPTAEREHVIAEALRVGAVAILFETASRLVEDEDNPNMSALQSALGHIARMTGAATLTTHHPTKAATKDNDASAESARGGGAFIANARNMLSVFPAEAETASTYRERFPPGDVLTLRHGKATSSTRAEDDITLIRCSTTWGAVLHRPDDVAHTPEQARRNAARVEQVIEREREQLGRLLDVVAGLLPLGPVSPSALRDYVVRIGVPKRGLNDLVRVALERGVLKPTTAATGGRGVRLGLGRDPRKSINEQGA